VQKVVFSSPQDFYFYSMEVICLEEPAFYALVEQVVGRLKDKHGVTKEKWVADEEAMQLLNVKSKTTLQKLRDEGKIRFSHPQKKIILYDRDSIGDYLEKNARETF
jgi:Helix-turn-helix domain